MKDLFSTVSFVLFHNFIGCYFDAAAFLTRLSVNSTRLLFIGSNMIVCL